MKLTRRDVLAGTAALVVAQTCAPAWAQSNTMTLVVPFPPGGSTDTLARQLQGPLQTRLNRVVIVENKSGAAGSLGALQVAKSRPDGSSLLVTFDSHAVIPSILEKPPLDVEKDLVPVLLVGTAPYVIAANADLPYKSFADVLAAAKAKPGSVKYASVGIGTLGHLAMTVLGQKAGVDMLHVPYRGGGPAITDLAGGRVDAMIASPLEAAGQVQAGRIRPLAVAGSPRIPSWPEVPTAAEVGLPGFSTPGWFGLVAPAGVPDAIVALLNAEIRAVLALEEVRARFVALGSEAAPGSPEDFGRLLSQQRKQWSEAVAAAKLQMD